MKRVLSFMLALCAALGMVCLGEPAQAAGKKLIAVTYDDGPGPYTERLLDGLKKRGVKATFFMQGMNAARYEKTVARMYREGHQLANHTYNHPDLTRLSAGEIQSQVNRTNSILDKAAGKGADYLLRPPYGSYNSAVGRAVGAPMILWSIDPQDWLYRNAATVKNNVLRNAHDGAVLLLHDIHSTTVDGSLSAIDSLKAQGYEFVTVRELFRRRGRTLSAGSSYSQANPNGKDLGPVQQPEITSQPKGGQLEITITAQKGTAVYYSLDGSDLNQQSRRYTGPFTVQTPCTVKACAAYNMNGSRSDTLEKKFDRPAAPAPVLHIENGFLIIEGTTPEVAVYYSVSGAQDSNGNQLYTGPVALVPGVRVSAYGAGEGYYNSASVRIAYSPLGNVFRDVFHEAWYFDAVDKAAAEGIIQGQGDGVFAPKDSVTRGQLVTFLHRISQETGDVPAGEGSPFTDVPEGKYYTEAVAWAVENDVASGYEDYTFRPDRKVTRQEMACILYRYMTGCCGAALSAGGLESFQDRNTVADWAKEAADALSASGILQGDTEGNFRPADGCTRAEAAAVLLRVQGYAPPAI